MRLALPIGTMIAVAALAGCGGSVPGLSPLSNSLTEGINGSTRTQSSKGRQIAERSPWDVDALRKVAPKPKFGSERVEKAGDKTVVVRDVTFEAEPVPGSRLSLAGTYVTPERPKGDQRRLAALVLVGDRDVPATEEQAREWAGRGYAALALELPGKGKGREKVRSTGPDWTDEALTNPSPAANPLHASVGSVVAAVNLLAGYAEVDARRIGLVGEGWGGVVADLAGAVDDRPRVLVLDRAAGGLEHGPLAAPLKQLSPKDREAWTKAYDPNAYAKADHPATLFVLPLDASEPSLSAVTTTFRGRSGAKTLALIPAEAKDGDAVTTVTWLATQLLGAEPLPEIRSLRADDEGALITTGGKLPPRSVTVFYTSGGLSKAEWNTVEGEKAGDRDWKCALPKPENGRPLTVFAALTDARGAIVCSEPGPLTTGKAEPKGKAVAERAAR